MQLAKLAFKISCIELEADFMILVNFFFISNLAISFSEGKNQNSVDKCYFHGDKRWHHEGTHWYPYVHPFGYIECAVCSCVVSNFQNLK